MPVANKLFVILFLVINSFPVYANTKEDCQALIDKGRAQILQKKYSSALEYFSKAETLSQQNGWFDKLVVAKAGIGSIYQDISNYDDALDYYLIAEQLAKQYGLKKQHLVLLNNIGQLYHALDDYESALRYYNKAYPLAWERKDSYSRVLLAINISDIYNEKGYTKQARAYLSEVKDLPTSKRLEQALKINLAESYFKEGNIEKAKSIAQGIIEEMEINRDEGCYTCITKLLSEIYTEQKRFDLAISYAEKGIHATADLRNKMVFYKQLSDLYSKKEDHYMSVVYKDSVIAARDSLAALINQVAFEVNKANLDLQDYQKQIIILKEKHSFRRNINIVIIIFSIILLISGFVAYQYRLRREKREQIILENNHKIARLELDNIKNNIFNKNKRIVSKALYIKGRNELIHHVIISLKKMQDSKNHKSISYMIDNLQRYLKSDDAWDELVEHFEKVNPEFINKLKELHPDLSENDIRFISYIYMGMDIKEISDIFNITINASRIREQRILQKMGQEKDTSLSDYLMKFS